MLSWFGIVSPGVCASIISSRMSISIGLVFLPFVATSDNAFAAQYLTSSSCETSKSIFDNWSFHQVIWPVESAKLRINFLCIVARTDGEMMTF